MQISASPYAPYVHQQAKVALPIEVNTMAPHITAGGAANVAQKHAVSAELSMSQEVQTTLLATQEAGSAERVRSAVAPNTNTTADAGTELDELFSDNPHTSSKRLIGDLPPLLFPSAENIEAISQHASARFNEMLAQYGIPSAPSEIVYSNEGKMRLPADYPYAEDLKRALEENPGLERELRTLNGMSSHYAELQKRAPFLDEISTARTQAEADQIVRRYSYLFQDNQSYSRIALTFSESGDLSITADGKNVLGHRAA